MSNGVEVAATFSTPLAFSTAVPPRPPVAQQVAYYAYCYVLPVICVLGILGNLTNLVVLASRRLRAVSYMYLRALAVADLLCMLFVLCFVTLEILNEHGISMEHIVVYRFYRIHLMLTLINWAVGTGVFVVVALSLERYISIIFPMHFRMWNSPQRAAKAIAIAYVLPCFLYLPYGICRYKAYPTLNPIDNSTVWIVGDSEIAKTFGWAIYKWTRESLLRFGPILALCILNIQIMLAFRKRQKMFVHLTKRKEQNSTKDDTLLYMLGGTVVMFFICNIPAAINLLFISETLKKRPDYQIFRAVANILEITNHASQFYVFCACSTDYRTTFLLKFPCFQKNYANPASLRNIVKRTQSMMTREHDSMDRTTTGSPKSCVGQMGIASSSCSQLGVIGGQRQAVIEADIKLICADEEARSESERECDSLLRYNPLQSCNGGSTFL